MRRRNTLIGAMLMYKGEADGMLCGTFGTHALHLQYIDQVIGLRPGVRHYAAMNALMLPARTVFICDTYVTPDPDAENIAEMTLLAAEEIRRFGIMPKVALLSASNFGSIDLPSSRKMQRALALLAGARARARDRGRDARRRRALRGDPHCKVFPRSRLRARRTCSSCRRSTRPTSPSTCSRPPPATASPSARSCSARRAPVHILTPSATVRRIVNMTALAVVDANAPRGQEQTLF